MAAGIAAASALVLVSCFGANVAVSGKQDSALAPNVGKRVEISIKSTSSLGSPWGGMSGSLRDNGTNPAFPHGVKLNFNRGVATAIGEYCNQALGGPSRQVHGIGGSLTRGVTTGPTGPGGPCGSSAGEDPRLWFGLVTYASADTKRYPNTITPECTYAYSVLNAYLFLGLGGLLGPTVAPKSSTSTSGNVAGFGLMIVVDSDANRNFDRNDRFSFVALCGPYANLDLSGVVGPGPADGSRTYSYGTCTDSAAPYPGMVPGTDLVGDPVDWLSALGGALSEDCLRTFVSGNAVITPVFEWVTGPTGPMAPTSG